VRSVIRGNGWARNNSEWLFRCCDSGLLRLLRLLLLLWGVTCSGGCRVSRCVVFLEPEAGVMAFRQDGAWFGLLILLLVGNTCLIMQVRSTVHRRYGFGSLCFVLRGRVVVVGVAFSASWGNVLMPEQLPWGRSSCGWEGTLPSQGQLGSTV